MDEHWQHEQQPRVIDAAMADAQSRRRALAPAEAAWWWMTHDAANDADAREIQILRLRRGLDLLVVQ